MVKQSRGMLSGKTRRLKGKSKTSVSQFVRTFNVGDKVTVKPKSTEKGRPHMRYTNRHGVIVSKRGKSYIVEIMDYKKKKQLIVGPIHLQLAS